MQKTQEAGKVGNKEGTLITSRKKNEKKNTESVTTSWQRHQAIYTKAN